MAERAGGARLVHEALDDVGVARELRVQDLDRDLALEQHVLREKDGAHSSAIERPHDAIPPRDDFARGDDRSGGLGQHLAGSPCRARRL